MNLISRLSDERNDRAVGTSRRRECGGSARINSMFNIGCDSSTIFPTHVVPVKSSCSHIQLYNMGRREQKECERKRAAAMSQS